MKNDVHALEASSEPSSLHNSIGIEMYSNIALEDLEIVTVTAYTYICF